MRKSLLIFTIISILLTVAFAGPQQEKNLPSESREELVKKEFDKCLDPNTKIWWIGYSPEIEWSDIPILLELAEDNSILNKVPVLEISSYAPGKGIRGMAALWLIEGMREKQNSITLDKQILKKTTTKEALRLPLCSFGVKKEAKLKDCEADLQIHKDFLKAYQKWWQFVKDLPSEQAACFDPLALTDYQWYGPRRINRRTDLIYLDEMCTYLEIHKNAQVVKQIIYVPKEDATEDSTIKKPEDFFEPYKCILFYYDKDGQIEKTEQFCIGEGIETEANNPEKEKLTRKITELKNK